MKCYKCLKILSKQEAIYGLHEACYKEWFALDKLEEFHSIISIGESKWASNAVDKFSGMNSSFFHGKFRKYSAELGEQGYILKIRQKDYQELPATEYLSNQIARSLGIPVPDFYLIRFENLPTFVTKNFIRFSARENLVHIYHFLKDDSEFNCETFIQVIKAQIGRLGDLEAFIHLCLFDVLIGNHDRHGRNLAVIESPKGKRLAPFYDNPTYLGVEVDELLGASHSPRGKITTKKSKEPSMREYVDEFCRLGYAPMVAEFKKRVSIADIERLISVSFISTKRKAAIKRLVRSRYDELSRCTQ